MGLISLYITLMYVFGLFVLTQKYRETGLLLVGDVIMIVMSPVSMLSVLAVKIVSTFVDVDAIIMMRKEE